jgi:toxin YoeB
MRLVFDQNGLEDLRFWIDTDRRKALKIIDLIEAVLKSPTEGIGKPEPLKFELAGCWSRRIDQEHRLVYRVERGELIILACRYHYEN